MGDFALVQRGDFAPAACIRCKRDEMLVDLGADDIYSYGRPYLCTVCFGELADAFRFVSPEIVEGQKRSYEARLLELQELRAVAENRVRELLAAPSPTEASLERLISDVQLAAARLSSDLRGGAPVLVPERDEVAAPAGRGGAGLDVGAAQDPARAAAAGGGAGAADGDLGTRNAAAITGYFADGGFDGDDLGGHDDDEGDAGAASDFDDWVAGLGVFDGEDPELDAGDARD